MSALAFYLLVQLTFEVSTQREFQNYERSAKSMSCSDEDIVVITSNVGDLEYAEHSMCGIRIEEGVTSIGASGFQDCSELSEVALPSTLTSIGCHAFRDCKMLSTIDIPDSITEIQNGTFHSCISLASVHFSFHLKLIEFEAFRGCSSLADITLPAALLSIEANAFYDTRLASVGFCGTKDVTTTEPAFDSSPHIYVSYSYTSSTFAGVDVTFDPLSMDCNVFALCKDSDSKAIKNREWVSGSLRYRTSGDGREFSVRQGDSCPIGDLNIGSKMTVDEWVNCNNVPVTQFYMSSKIGAFHGCSELTSVIFPELLTSIQEYAFYGCSQLKSIKVPGCVSSIESWTFGGCRLLEEVELPDSLTSIGSYVFDRCASLKSLDIPENVMLIGSAVFYYCAALIDVNLPPGLTLIEQSMFRECSSLKSLIIPDGVTSIGSYAFGACSNLADIHLPASLESIEANAFRDCLALTWISLPSNLSFVGLSAFSNAGLTCVGFFGSGDVQHDDSFPAATRVYVLKGYNDNTFCGLDVVCVDSNEWVLDCRIYPTPDLDGNGDIIKLVAIVGGVVGGLFVTVLIVILTIMRMRQKKKDESSEGNQSCDDVKDPILPAEHDV